MIPLEIKIQLHRTATDMSMSISSLACTAIAFALSTESLVLPPHRRQLNTYKAKFIRMLELRNQLTEIAIQELTKTVDSNLGSQGGIYEG